MGTVHQLRGIGNVESPLTEFTDYIYEDRIC